MNKKIGIITVFIAVCMCLAVAQLDPLSAAKTIKIDSGTKYYDHNTEKIVWTTYTSESKVIIHMKEYEKKGGRWVLEDYEKIVMQKISKKKLKITCYEDDGDIDRMYKTTSLSAKSYYLKIFKSKVLKNNYFN